MPIFSYVCQRCSHSEHRVTGIDDHVVQCSHCGQPMIRTTGMAMLFRHYGGGVGYKNQ